MQQIETVSQASRTRLRQFALSAGEDARDNAINMMSDRSEVVGK